MSINKPETEDILFTLTFVYEWFPYMYVCALHACLAPVEANKSHWIP